MQKDYLLLALLISFSVFSQDKKNSMIKFDTSGMEKFSTDVNNQNTICLEQNPITGALTILCSSTFEQAKVSVVDLTGKMVYNHNLKTKFIVK